MAKFQFEFDSVTKEGRFTKDGQEVAADYVSFGKRIDYEKGQMVWGMSTANTEHDEENEIHTNVSVYASEFAASALRLDKNNENTSK